MQKRKSQYGAFWGCSTFPHCKTTENIDNKNHLVKNASHGSNPGKKRTDKQIAEDSVVLTKMKTLTIEISKLMSSMDNLCRAVELLMQQHEELTDKLSTEYHEIGELNDLESSGEEIVF